MPLFHPKTKTHVLSTETFKRCQALFVRLNMFLEESIEIHMTCNLKMAPWNRRFLLEPSFVGSVLNLGRVMFIMFSIGLLDLHPGYCRFGCRWAVHIQSWGTAEVADAKEGAEKGSAHGKFGGLLASPDLLQSGVFVWVTLSILDSGMNIWGMDGISVCFSIWFR